MTRTFAAADIGSNTAHLLVAATDGELVMRIDNLNEWIALGEVVTRRGEIPRETADELVRAMREFRQVASSKKAQSLYVFATEAMRVARNHDEVLRRISAEANVPVDVISPMREAELSLRGALLDAGPNGLNLLFEVGGGSVQVARVAGSTLAEECSLPLGTGRIIASFGLASPCAPAAYEAAEQMIAQTLAQCAIQHRGGSAAISGGVGRGLWRALHPDGHKTLALEELDYLIWATRGLSIDRIVNRFNVKTKRAGTLLPGAMVYRALMRRFGLESVTVSEFGVREGAILELADGKVKGCRV